MIPTTAMIMIIARNAMDMPSLFSFFLRRNAGFLLRLPACVTITCSLPFSMNYLHTGSYFYCRMIYCMSQPVFYKSTQCSKWSQYLRDQNVTPFHIDSANRHAVQKHSKGCPGYCKSPYHTMITVIEQYETDAKAPCPIQQIFQIHHNPVMMYQSPA